MVLDQPAPNFFHREALGFVRRWRHRRIVREAEPRAPAQLLGAKRSDVDEEEAALNRGHRFEGGRVSGRRLFGQFVHARYRVTRRGAGRHRLRCLAYLPDPPNLPCLPYLPSIT